MTYTQFAPHKVCLMFNQNLIWLNVVTDGLVALSYYSIPIALFIVATRKRDVIPLRPLLLLFGLFIAFCGGGHVMDIISIWTPIYWLKGFWNAGTAFTSVITAIVLIPKVQGFIRLPERAQKLQEEKEVLEEKHGILQSVLGSVSEGILLASPSGRPLAFNSAAAEILGASREPRVDWPGHAPVDQDIQKTADGRIVERFTKNIPEVGQLYVLRDITERRRSEESRLRLEHVIATMRQGFATVSIDDSLGDEAIQTPNPALAEMHGYAVPELAGLSVTALLAGSAAERRQTFRTIREAVERESFWEGEILSARKDGTRFYTHVRFHLHQGEERRFLSFTQRDIDEQRRMREEAARLQSKLLQAQRLESLGVLAGGVAHDFNNLLTGVMGNTTLALDILPPEHALAPRLQDILTAAERAAGLTRQLLAYSGKGKFIIEPASLSSLVEETQSLVQISIPRTVQLEIRAAPDLPRVEADPSQIQQLLMNLVINAAEAIGDKPGVVRVTTGKETLETKEAAKSFLGAALSAGDYVSVEVRDNGCGMDEETQAQIFDPFFTTKFTGRGLGLAAALGIVRSHCGAMKVTSVLGQGSSFKVLFPARKGGAQPARPAGSAADLRGSGTVLVVDDEETVRTIMYSALRHYGYDVLQAENGAQAVEIFERTAPVISTVLLDMTMPVMSGEETLRRLRQIRSDVPIVVASGFNESETAGRFAGQDVSGFLKKPFTVTKLGEAVRKACAQAR